MPIPEDILKGLKCCLSQDGHYVYEPISLECGANACKKCIDNVSNANKMKCQNCLQIHQNRNYSNFGVNIMVKNIMNLFLNDLIEELGSKLEFTEKQLKSILKIN